MPTIDPNRPGYYTDGTPVQAVTQSPQGYPIGTNVNASVPASDPAVTQQANAIRTASSSVQPISRPGNPYNAQGNKVTHITAANKTTDNDARGAYDYYGVPTLASRVQGNEQYEFQEKLKQWAAEFEEMKKQNRFGNQMDWNKFDGFAATNPITGEKLTRSPSSSGGQSATMLPASISALHPGATNITKYADGSYTFTNSNGSRGYYSG